MDRHDARVDDFTVFVGAHEAGLRSALTASLGWDLERDQRPTMAGVTGG